LREAKEVCFVDDFEKLMEKSKYFMTFDTFLEEHPEVDPAWREFMEPVFMENERKLFVQLLQLR
jgi:hypothetical protein